MPIPRVALIPVGRVEVVEVEGAAARVAKVLHGSVELRSVATMPKGLEDPDRGQHRAKEMLAALRAEIGRLPVSKMVGGATPSPSGAAPAASAPGPLVAVFVTDVDLFTPDTDAVRSEIAPAQRAALVSVRRLREAHWKRKADPPRQRARLVKEILRAVGRLAGLPDCGEAECPLAAERSVSELDRKAEHFCASCWKRMSLGTMRI